ncbi:unnamed protein product, partial [Staurois parvus]
VRDQPVVASSGPQTRIPQGAESKLRPACSPEPLMVGMDLEQAERPGRDPWVQPAMEEAPDGGTQQVRV